MSGREIIVVGSSAGGLGTLSEMSPGLPVDFPSSTLIVCHLSPDLAKRTSGFEDQAVLADQYATLIVKRVLHANGGANASGQQVKNRSSY